MSRPIYRKGQPYAARARQLLSLAVRPELDSRQDRYTLALVHSVRERLTERELECMAGYYVQGLALTDLGPKLYVNPSTVCRNIHRGQRKLDELVRLIDEIHPIGWVD